MGLNYISHVCHTETKWRVEYLNNLIKYIYAKEKRFFYVTEYYIIYLYLGITVIEYVDGIGIKIHKTTIAF